MGRFGFFHDLKDYQIIAVHEFLLGQLAGADGGGIETRDAPRKFRPLVVADAQHVARREFPFAAQQTGRQETPAFVAQGGHRSVVHKQRPLGMMKERNPPLAPAQFA